MAASATSGSSRDQHDEEDQNDVVTRDLLLHVKSLTLSDNQQKPARLLIFDLNGLLIHRAHKFFPKPGDPTRPPDAVVGNHFVYRRPFCKEFIGFCLERFEVAIWSSAMERNMNGVMDLVFGSELSSKILFIWSQSSCSDYGFKSPEKKDKPMYFKELRKVWESRERWTRNGSFSATNTLLIDDGPYKGLLNPPNTGIFPNSYNPKDANDKALDPEEELGLYLKGLAEAEDDVPTYVESHPFGQPAIKEGHPEWRFYSKILSQINKSDKLKVASY